MNVFEQLAENFYRWEARGRGALTFEAPVELEPPFVPFPGHRLRVQESADDGTRPTFLSKLTDKMFQAARQPKTDSLKAAEAPDEEPQPQWFGREKERPVEFQVLLPADATHPPDAMTGLLRTLSLLHKPVAFELIGTSEKISAHITVRIEDAEQMEHQLEAQFPEMKLSWSQELLPEIWAEDGQSDRVVIDFGLFREFMLPLDSSPRFDPFVSLIGAMAHLDEGEVAVYQVIFSPLEAPWRENAMAAVTKGDGKPFFDDGANLVKGATEKMGRPLYGVVLRLAAKSQYPDRSWEVIRELAPALRLFSKQGGQSLMPLSNANYDHEAHCHDLVLRRSRRCGMILNLDELVGLVHWPTAAVKSEKLARWVDDRSRAAPAAQDARPDRGGVILGVNDHGGHSSAVWLNDEQRVRHLHIIGGTGTGKSTMLFNLIRQDLENGEGCAVLDPHGDLIDRILGVIPRDRIDDVVLLDPSDEQFIVPFNILSAHSDFEKMLIASDLVGVFQRLSTSWGDQMNSVFRQAVLAFLESTEGGTLADLRRFLLDPPYREKFLQTVNDADVRFYWKRGFAQLGGNKSIGPILTRLETLLSPKPLRLMLSQQENKLDFAEIMDSGRILLARLPQGQIGRENAFLLGSLLVSKLQQMAMSRQRMSAAQRRPFFCYVDEFQNFITPSMAEILSSARKYRMGLILAHQELRQLEKDKEVASAVLANAYTRVVFRVSDADARALGEGFAHFETRDLQNLAIGEAVCRMERADGDFNLSVPLPPEIDESEASERRAAVIDASRIAYAIPRSEVEAELLRRLDEEEAQLPVRKSKTPPTEPRVVTKSDTNAAADTVNQESAPLTDAEPTTPADSAPQTTEQPPDTAKSAPPQTAGMGRGGLDHQHLVEQLCVDGARFGYRASKEFAVPGGRVDIALEKRERRIAIEVAVNSNTAHEIENIQKCLAGGFGHVVSLSPLPNVTENIRRAAQRQLAPEQLALVQFHSPESLLMWLNAVSAGDEVTPPADEMRTFGGRRVRIKHVQLAPDERARLESEHIAAIAEILNSASSTEQT